MLEQQKGKEETGRIIDIHVETINSLRSAMLAADERLRAAGQRVGIAFGCDTADHMADEIEALNKNVNAAEERWRIFENKDREWAEAAKEAGLIPQYVGHPSRLTLLNLPLVKAEEVLKAYAKLDDHTGQCEDCCDGGHPELCEIGFPLADKARLLMWAYFGIDSRESAELAISKLYNPQVGTCIDCGLTIWFSNERGSDTTPPFNLPPGDFHTLCRAVKVARIQAIQECLSLARAISERNTR